MKVLCKRVVEGYPDGYIIDIGNGQGILIEGSTKLGPVHVENVIARSQTPWHCLDEEIDARELLRNARPARYYQVDESQLT